MSSVRAALVDGVARRIAGIELFRPLRVCIDGPDAAGKTMLGDELASYIEARGAAHSIASRAARVLASAGTRAMARSDVASAVNLLDRAVDLTLEGGPIPI
jgi:cytidylate kinase